MAYSEQLGLWHIECLVARALDSYTAFASWLAGLPGPVCGRGIQRDELASLAGRAPFWVPEYQAHDSAEHPAHTHAHMHTHGRPRPGRRVSCRRTGGEGRGTGNCCRCSHFHTALPSPASFLLSVTSQSSSVLCFSYSTIFNRYSLTAQWASYYNYRGRSSMTPKRPCSQKAASVS